MSEPHAPAPLIYRDYTPADREAFRRLNEAWIQRYFVLEAMDHAMLGDPQGTILTPGGAILMAEEAGQAIGCGALLRHDARRYEIAKLAVDERHQGRGAGRELMRLLIERARALEASEIILETNSRLGPAVALYRSLGFAEVPTARFDEHYSRVDLVMLLTLEPRATET